MIEHGANYFSLTHHLIQFLITAAIQFTVFQLIDKIIGILHSFISSIPNFFNITSHRCTVKTTITISGSNITGIHSHIHITIQTESTQVSTTIHVTAQQLSIYTIQCTVYLGLVIEDILIIVFRRSFHFKEIIT